MTIATCEFDSNTMEVKKQRASRRAVSLSKDRTEYKKQSSVSSKTGRKTSVGPVGSDFANPHGAARAATRTCLANGEVSGSSDMPQISMGRAGSSWVRWVRKPSVSSARSQHSLSIEQLELDEYFISPTVKSSQDSADAPLASLPVCSNHSSIIFQTDLGDQKAFPALALTEVKLAAQVPQGSWAAAVEQDKKYELPAADLTPEKWLQVSVEGEAEDQGEATRKHKGVDAEQLTPDKLPQFTPQKQEVADELAEDWIVVTSDEAGKAAACLSQMARPYFDTQHPRNIFGKKAASKQERSEADCQEAANGIDWSQTGMPSDLLRRLIGSSVNAAHHGLHSENKMEPLPGHIMRAQNIGSSKREKSTPTTPRSHSKPRAMRQTSGGR